MVGALIPNDAIEMATAPGVGPDADALTLGMVEFERASFVSSGADLPDFRNYSMSNRT